MFEKILLAVDGSEHALHATRTAAELARAMNSKVLRIIVAYDPIPLYLGEPNMQVVITNRSGEAEEILKAAVKEVGDVPAGIHTEIIEAIRPPRSSKSL